MLLISPARPVIVNPQKQVSVGWRKAVGLLKTDYVLCQIYVEKSYYEGGETANISVHVDNSKVKDACSLNISHKTKIKMMASGRKHASTQKNCEQKYFLCHGKQKESKLLQF